MAAGDDIFQQYRNAGAGSAAPASAATSTAPPPASAAATPTAGGDIFQQYRANPPSTTAPASTAAAAPSDDKDKAEAYGMMAPGFAPGTTGRDIANAFVGGIYGVGADVARNLGITPNALPADVQSTMAAHPLVTGAGRFLGGASVGASLALGAEVAAPLYAGVGLGGAGWVPSLARGAITGAGLGAAQNALAGDPDESLLTRARVGAEWGAPLGLLGGASGKALGPDVETGATTETPPATAAEAKAIASAYYDQADAAGGVLSPEVTNKFLDNAAATTPQTAAGRAVAGQSTTAALVERLQSLRDQPLTLQAAQEIDSGLGALISKEYGPGGLSQDGKQLLDIQSDFRDQIKNAGPGDIQGGAVGFDAWNLGRQAWAQARKMDDLEQIMERASQTDNPATSIKSQVRTLINSKRSRGYDDEEMAALKDAANRGVIGGALHVFGSRLIPYVAGAVGSATGPLHAIGAALGAHAATAGVRRAAEALQARRLTNVLGTVARGVPPSPLTPP